MNVLTGSARASCCPSAARFFEMRIGAGYEHIAPICKSPIKNCRSALPSANPRSRIADLRGMRDTPTHNCNCQSHVVNCTVHFTNAVFLVYYLKQKDSAQLPNLVFFMQLGRNASVVNLSAERKLTFADARTCDRIGARRIHAAGVQIGRAHV